VPATASNGIFAKIEVAQIKLELRNTMHSYVFKNQINNFVFVVLM